MVFTEGWNIAKNTYDAILLSNKSIDNTTIIASWIARSNIDGAYTVRVYKSEENFKDFLSNKGAYAFGIINKSIKDTTLQGWYYNAPSLAKISWLQADTKIVSVDMGAQYAIYDPNNADSANAIALKFSYEYEGLGINLTYSKVSGDGQSFSNLGGAQSKLYTDAWWMVGDVASENTKAYSFSATYDLGFINTSVFYTHADHDSINTTMKETTVVFDKSIDSLDISLAYVNVKTTADDTDNQIQLYLTYNF